MFLRGVLGKVNKTVTVSKQRRVQPGASIFMNFSAPFIRRPIATTLLTLALGLAGVIAYQFLPVSPLPRVDFPTIQISAALPGASPETMASSVATPLERQLGRIAGVTEMTSTSFLGSTTIVLQFDLNRNIDGAARDVQAAINAARSQLPTNLPGNPFYRKVNPADSPILLMSLTSDLMDKAHMYDVASSVLQQKLSQVKGVGQVVIGGGALPAVRVDVNPTALNHYGISLEDLRAMLRSANANRPKGQVADGKQTWALNTTDQLMKAAEYQPLIVAYRNGGAVRLSDVANVTDTVDRVRALLPTLQAYLPPTIKLSVVWNATTTIRASVRDVQLALLTSIVLVILVVFCFLRSVFSTIIPSVAVPISLLGTLGGMYLLGYSVDNLSLMALTVATGFVVDDAIVVIENITRYLEQGLAPYEAAMRGAKEIGFTVISISLSLVAVFIPILLMGGIVGRLFREFAVTLSMAIGVSLLVSLTTTPMMCAKLLRRRDEETHGRLYRANERAFQWILGKYETSLAWVLRHQAMMLLITLLTMGATVFLYVKIPKGFFPQQDTGGLIGVIQGDQDISFQTMLGRLHQLVGTVMEDPAVDTSVAFTGGSGGTGNTARMFVILKPLDERRISADFFIGRLRRKLAEVPAVSLFLQAVQDLRTGGRPTAAQYQYTLQSDNVKDLSEWAPRVLEKLRTVPGLLDLNSDQQDRGLHANLVIDRATASRLGITTQMIDDTLYDAFGQRQVSVIYTQLNQYHVVMEVAPQFLQGPETLRDIYVVARGGKKVPLSAFAHYEQSTAPLVISHQGQFPSVNISFNLAPGRALGDAVSAVENAEREIGLPANIHGSFQGTAQAFQASLANEPFLIAAALIAVYIVLGMLYESTI